MLWHIYSLQALSHFLGTEFFLAITFCMAKWNNIVCNSQAELFGGKGRKVKFIILACLNDRELEWGSNAGVICATAIDLFYFLKLLLLFQDYEAVTGQGQKIKFIYVSKKHGVWGWGGVSKNASQHQI